MKVEIKRFVANEIFCRVLWQDPASGDGVTVDTRLPISEEYVTFEAQQRAIAKVPLLLRREAIQRARVAARALLKAQTD
jgi:hypothetical protein